MIHQVTPTAPPRQRTGSAVQIVFADGKASRTRSNRALRSGSLSIAGGKVVGRPPLTAL